MNIKTGKIAYYFPTTQLLEKFISLNESKIKYIDMMLYLRSRHDDICFILKMSEDGRIDWDAYTARFVKEWFRFSIIIFGKQRTE